MGGREGAHAACQEDVSVSLFSFCFFPVLSILGGGGIAPGLGKRKPTLCDAGIGFSAPRSGMLAQKQYPHALIRVLTR